MQVTLYILQTMGSSLYAPTEPRSAAPTDLMLNKLEQVSKSVKVSALCFSACVSVCLRIRINHLRTFSYIKIIGQKGLQYFNSKAYVRVYLFWCIFRLEPSILSSLKSLVHITLGMRSPD